MNNLAPSLLLIGGGGHCHSVMDAVLSAGEFQRIGIVDNDSVSDVMGFPVVGGDSDLPRLRTEGWSHAFITVGSMGNPAVRRRLYKKIQDLGFAVPNIIDPSAVVAQQVCLEDGVFVGKRAVVNANSHISACSILNTGCIVEHDCCIGAFVHISPGAILCGNVHIGENTHVGAGTVVRQQIHLAQDVLIGAGSVVLQDIPKGQMAYGNPCRMVKAL